MRVPKRGFKNINRITYTVIDLAKLELLADKHSISTIDYEVMRSLRLLRQDDKVKILANGEITKPLTVQAHAFSASAKKAIEDAGGTVNIIG